MKIIIFALTGAAFAALVVVAPAALAAMVMLSNSTKEKQPHEKQH